MDLKAIVCDGVAASAAWLLEQLDREPTDNEAAYRRLWES